MGHGVCELQVCVVKYHSVEGLTIAELKVLEFANTWRQQCFEERMGHSAVFQLMGTKMWCTCLADAHQGRSDKSETRVEPMIDKYKKDFLF